MHRAETLHPANMVDDTITAITKRMNSNCSRSNHTQLLYTGAAWSWCDFSNFRVTAEQLTMLQGLGSLRSVDPGKTGTSHGTC